MAAKRLPDQEYLRECFEYDAATGALTWRQRPMRHFPDARIHLLWNAQHSGIQAGGISHHRHTDYVTVSINSSRFLAHRIIWKLENGTEPPEVDHEDGNGTHNWLDNLRAADKIRNMQNARTRKNKTLPKGVGVRSNGKYRARIKVEKKEIALGDFDTPEEAHAAYCEAATRLHGEFANFGH